MEPRAATCCQTSQLVRRSSPSLGLRVVQLVDLLERLLWSWGSPSAVGCHRNRSLGRLCRVRHGLSACRGWGPPLSPHTQCVRPSLPHSSQHHSNHDHRVMTVEERLMCGWRESQRFGANLEKRVRSVAHLKGGGSPVRAPPWVSHVGLLWVSRWECTHNSFEGIHSRIVSPKISAPHFLTFFYSG